MATSEIKRLSVDLTGGPKRMVTPVLAGSFIPNNHLTGKRFQMYMRGTGDWWMNIDGDTTWLKIYEV